jgi:hypothetical protein
MDLVSLPVVIYIKEILDEHSGEHVLVSFLCDVFIISEFVYAI